MSEVHHEMRFGDAARAMRALLQNPDDTAQAFRIIEALSGRNGERTLERLKNTASGRRLLAGNRSLIETLCDRATMEKLPEGSLGREYLRFLDSEGITAEGLRQASLEGRGEEDVGPELEFLRNRMRDTHDLWHTLTGYKGDLLGEAALLAFSFAQTWNPGVGFIVGIALLRGREPQVRRLILQGFRRGVLASWLPAVEWEKLLALPLPTVRKMLGVDEPPVYQTVRSSEFLGEMAAA
ncbi:MAG TPA: Coq4 family protein [Polyangiaceae bacterium]|nr:Coq4 family protein [Polyangiaceae bacterium]